MSDFWKYFLFGEQGLFPDNTPLDGFVVCLQLEHRKYGKFKDAEDFCNKLYHWSRKSDVLPFFEIIPGDRPYKFFFDIDLAVTQDRDISYHFMTELLLVVERNWKKFFQKDFTSKDILLYSSHSESWIDGKKKMSWHIVFPEIIVQNCQVADFVAKEMIEGLESALVDYVDMSVYSRTRQMRLIFCVKHGSDRIKLPCKNWQFGKFTGEQTLPDVSKLPDEVDKHWILFSHMFRESCISYVGQKTVTIQMTEEMKIRNDTLYNITDELPNFPNLQPPEGFRFDGKRGNLIELRREKPSYCDLCCREHEHENAILIWFPNSGIMRYYCWRAKGTGKKSIIYARFPELKTEEISEVEEQIINEYLRESNEDRDFSPTTPTRQTQPYSDLNNGITKLESFSKSNFRNQIRQMS